MSKIMNRTLMMMAATAIIMSVLFIILDIYAFGDKGTKKNQTCKIFS